MACIWRRLLIVVQEYTVHWDEDGLRLESPKGTLIYTTSVSLQYADKALAWVVTDFLEKEYKFEMAHVG